jgi:hypothetical protein
LDLFPDQSWRNREFFENFVDFLSKNVKMGKIGDFGSPLVRSRVRSSWNEIAFAGHFRLDLFRFVG